VPINYLTVLNFYTDVLLKNRLCGTTRELACAVAPQLFLDIAQRPLACTGRRRPVRAWPRPSRQNPRTPAQPPVAVWFDWLALMFFSSFGRCQFAKMWIKMGNFRTVCILLLSVVVPSFVAGKIFR